MLEKDTAEPEENAKSVNSPCWSPDGTKICYNIYVRSNGAGNSNLHHQFLCIPKKYLNDPPAANPKFLLNLRYWKLSQSVQSIDNNYLFNTVQ